MRSGLENLQAGKTHALVTIYMRTPVPQVAREVFNSCLMGELSAKTRVLVTNQLQFVSAADLVIFMAGGQIAEIGTYADMVAAGKAFAQLMSQAEVRPGGTQRRSRSAASCCSLRAGCKGWQGGCAVHAGHEAVRWSAYLLLACR